MDLDFKLTYIALLGCAPILIYRFFWKKRRFHILRKIDWFTLIFFAAMFVLMESVWNTGFFQGLISSLSLDITSMGIILILGVCNLILVFFQAASGLRIIRPKFGVHKKTGLALVVFATAHAVLAFLANQ